MRKSKKEKQASSSTPNIQALSADPEVLTDLSGPEKALSAGIEELSAGESILGEEAIVDAVANELAQAKTGYEAAATAAFQRVSDAVSELLSPHSLAGRARAQIDAIRNGLRAFLAPKARRLRELRGELKKNTQRLSYLREALTGNPNVEPDIAVGWREGLRKYGVLTVIAIGALLLEVMLGKAVFAYFANDAAAIGIILMVLMILGGASRVAVSCRRIQRTQEKATREYQRVNARDAHKLHYPAVFDLPIGLEERQRLADRVFWGGNAVFLATRLFAALFQDYFDSVGLIATLILVGFLVGNHLRELMKDEEEYPRDLALEYSEIIEEIGDAEKEIPALLDLKEDRKVRKFLARSMEELEARVEEVSEAHRAVTMAHSVAGRLADEYRTTEAWFRRKLRHLIDRLVEETGVSVSRDLDEVYAAVMPPAQFDPSSVNLPEVPEDVTIPADEFGLLREIWNDINAELDEEEKRVRAEERQEVLLHAVPTIDDRRTPFGARR